MSFMYHPSRQAAFLPDMVHEKYCSMTIHMMEYMNTADSMYEDIFFPDC